MVEPKYDSKLGVWKCPLCGWTAMSKKVVEAHIQREHPEAVSSQKSGQNKDKATPIENGKKRQNSNGNNKKRRWKRFKIGDITIKMLDRDEIEVKDQRGWVFFLTANYVAALHKQRARVKLITGEEFAGILKARDPYFVGLVMKDGRKIYINKAHIVWIEPIRGEANE